MKLFETCGFPDYIIQLQKNNNFKQKLKTNKYVFARKRYRSR